jgi:hypothetical protein
VRNAIHVLVAGVAVLCVGGFLLIGPAAVLAVALLAVAVGVWLVATESMPGRRRPRLPRRAAR